MTARKPTRQELQSTLPWYANGSLEGEEKRQVETWLRSDEEAWSELEAWQEARLAVRRQPEASPSEAVRASLMNRVHQSRAAASRPFWGEAVLWLAGLALTMVVLVVLWWAVRPGVVLQWALQAPVSAPASFKIYRAPAGSQAFTWLADLPAQTGQTQFSYIDAWLVPGVKYVYRVEGVSAGSVVAFSQVDSDALAALPGQLAILLTSAVISYSLMMLLQHKLEGWLAFRPPLLNP